MSAIQIETRRLSALIQQPFHPLDVVFLQLLAKARLGKPRPETMREARIYINQSLDTVLLPQYLFVNQSLVSKRIHAAYLEIGCWKVFMGFEDDRRS